MRVSAPCWDVETGMGLKAEPISNGLLLHYFDHRNFWSKAMNGDVPLWLDAIVMMGAGALAGGAAAAVTGRDIRSRAAGSAVTFGLMTIAWRMGGGTENKVRQMQGLPPKMEQ